jgi:hypothetical protein
LFTSIQCCNVFSKKKYIYFSIIATQPPSVNQTTVNSPVNCNFEDIHICNYVQDKTDRFDWSRNQGGTRSSSTGPSADHTLGTNHGGYMYTEASRPRRQRDAARLDFIVTIFS